MLQKQNDYIFNQNYIVNGKNINNPKPEEIKDNLWFHLDYEEIVHRIVKASSFKLNWILDPFMNVGAVGVVAKKEVEDLLASKIIRTKFFLR